MSIPALAARLTQEQAVADLLEHVIVGGLADGEVARSGHDRERERSIGCGIRREAYSI